MPELRSDFQANGADTTGAPALPGLVPALGMGQTLSAAMDAVDASADMAPAPDGWVMKTLFRDWGDTAGDGDGGYETAAIVVKNLGEGTEHPFDRTLAGKHTALAAQLVFNFSITVDGTRAFGTTLTPTSVSINIDGTTPQTPQWNAMVFASDSLVPAQTQDLMIDVGETFRGTYYGAPGQYRCISGAPTGESCALVRRDDGMVVVHDIRPEPNVVDSTGRWSFTPDPDAMITVPDQDWMAYGAWLTTPDNPAGGAEAHRLGVFFNGLDRWTGAINSVTATNAAGLRGTATYSGGATGVYVDGDASGLFTARAMLTANFDANTNGAADAGDYTISGRIDNFRGTNGAALGADTGDMPNPQGRGENDWVVELGSATIVRAGAIAATGTSGSADGVSWTGQWDGRFFGPTTTVDGDPASPSGVAGRFWAETADPDATDAAMNPVTAVVGAFGADRDD